MAPVLPPRQLAFALGHHTSFAREDFLEGPSNRAALALIDAWPDWPDRLLAVIGPEGSGKSHLAAIWAEAAGARFLAARALGEANLPRALSTGALVIENLAADALDERAMFHLINLAREQGAFILMTAAAAPSGWALKVADLASRLRAAPVAEHDDIYQGGGHQYIILGPKLIEPPGQCRSNHDVICALAARVGARHPGFTMTPRELIDWTLVNSGWGTLAELEERRWIDCQPDFATAHYLDGFAWPDRKFRFKPEWPTVPFPRQGRPVGPFETMPSLPDHWNAIEEADVEHPFRLATSPARSFLNSSFTETPTAQATERRPHVMIHPEDAAALGIAHGDKVVLGNRRGEVRLHASVFPGVRRGVLIAESVFPNATFEDGCGINTLTGADCIAPFGGAAFHDNRVWMKRAA